MPKRTVIKLCMCRTFTYGINFQLKILCICVCVCVCVCVEYIVWASQVGLVVKNPSANSGDIKDVGLIPGLGRSPGEGNGNPLQYSCLENPTDRGAWQATVHRVAKSQT